MTKQHREKVRLVIVGVQKMGPEFLNFLYQRPDRARIGRSALWNVEEAHAQTASSLGHIVGWIIDRTNVGEAKPIRIL